MKKIVLVDDYLDFAKEIKNLIEWCNNIKCIAFSDPREALEYITSNPDIDYVITDYEMPYMNGFELAQKILLKCPNIKITVSSGHSMEKLKRIREEYNLNGKVNVMEKTDIEFYTNLENAI